MFYFRGCGGGVDNFCCVLFFSDSDNFIFVLGKRLILRVLSLRERGRGKFFDFWVRFL